MLAPQRNVNGSTEEFLHLPFSEKGCFLWNARCCMIYEERNNKCLEGRRGTLMMFGPW